MTNSIKNSVIASIIGGAILGSVALASEVVKNTEYRLNSKQSEMMVILLEIKANQEFLLKEYHRNR